MMRMILIAGAVAGLGCAATIDQTRPGADPQVALEELIARDDQLAAESEQFQSVNSAFERFRLDVQKRHLESGYREFIRQQPIDVRAMNAYAGFLYDQRRFDDAVLLWQQVIALPPATEADRRALALSYNNLANHLGHEGGATTALRCYDRAIELDPNDPAFYFNWATTCFMMRNEARTVYGWDNAEIFRRSLERLRKARDLAPQDFEYSSAYAEMFYLLPEPDWHEAYQGWQYCLNQSLDDTNRERVYTHLARVCLKMNRLDEARTWLDKVRPGGPMEPIRRALERRLAEATRRQAPPE